MFILQMKISKSHIFIQEENDGAVQSTLGLTYLNHVWSTSGLFPFLKLDVKFPSNFNMDSKIFSFCMFLSN